MLALHKANGLGRKRNLRHNTSHTQADGRWGTGTGGLVGRNDTRAEMQDQGQGQSQRRAVVSGEALVTQMESGWAEIDTRAERDRGQSRQRAVRARATPHSLHTWNHQFFGILSRV